MSVSRSWPGFALAAAVALSYAGNTAAARLAFDGGASPLTMNASRLATAGVLLLVLLLILGVPTRLARRDRLVAWALGPLMFGYQFALLSAIETIPLALAILIFYTFPIMTAVVSWLSGREPPTPAGVAAVLLAFAGLALALNVPGGDLAPLGVGLAALSAVGLTTMLQVNHRLVGTGDSRPVTLHMIASATLSAAIVVVLGGGLALPATPAGWSAFAVSALLFSFAVTHMFVAMSMVGPMHMALTMNLEPVASMLLGVFLLGQPMTAIQAGGGALVIVAVLMVRLAPTRVRQGVKSHG